MIAKELKIKYAQKKNAKEGLADCFSDSGVTLSQVEKVKKVGNEQNTFDKSGIENIKHY